MSGIFGIYHRDEKSLEKKIATSLLETISYWNPDEKGIWSEGSIAFGHAMLWNTPESKLEHLPNKQDHLAITMDVRLDNRKELAEQLHITDRPLDEITDSDLILAAYKKWEKQCPKYLLGDFVFAIWDEKKKELFVARDHIGIKSLYYYVNDKLIVFGNDIRAILAHPSVPKKFNEKMIAYYLIEKKDSVMTFYEDIYKLEAATSMSISRSSLSQSLFWDIQDYPKIRYSCFEDYEQHLKKLLKQVIKDRIRSDYEVTSHLSGGLDSSSIAVVAARELSKKREIVHSYNWAYHPEKKNNPDHFEWANSDIIAQKEGIENEIIKFDLSDLEKIFEDYDVSMNDTLDFWYEYIVRDKSQERNSRTILSGWGGDEFISYGGGKSFYTELFWRGKPFYVLKEIFRQTRNFAFISYLQVLIKRLMKEIILPRVSITFFNKLYTFNYGGPSYKKLIEESGIATKCISKHFNITSKQNDRIVIGKRVETLNRFYDGYIQERCESWGSASFKNCLEYRFPLLDKRIIEFSLGIPLSLYRERTNIRFLYRKCIEELLPKDIIWSDTKYETKRVHYYQHLLYQYLKKWRSQFQSERKIESKYINLEDLYELIDSIEDVQQIINDEKSLVKAIIALKSIHILNIGKLL